MLDRRNDNKIAIGYDLGNITSQISYCAILEGAEPETISTIAGEENFNIPTVVCKRHQVNQWYYGNEAVKVSEDGEGILITDLLQKVILHEEIEIEGKFYSAKDLLKLFLRRTFSIMTSTLGIRKIDSLMITVDELSHPILEFLQPIKEEFSVEIKELYIQSREESFFYYVLMQESSLWIKDVLLCDLSEGILKTFRFELNRHTTPIVAFIEKRDYPEVSVKKIPTTKMARKNYLEQLDKECLEICKGICREQNISTIYLIGDAYDEEWLVQTLPFLCTKRRVFRGNNLFSKGAAIAAKERVLQSDITKNHIFLGNDKLKANIGMNLIRQGEEVYFAILDAGQNWCESIFEFEVLLEESNVISFVITPVTGQGIKNVDVILEGLPPRKGKACRVKILGDCIAECIIRIRVYDMGFGELVEATDLEWIEEIEI